MLKTKNGKLVQPATRGELVAEITRLNSAIKELIGFLRASDKEALAGVMEIVRDRGQF